MRKHPHQTCLRLPDVLENEMTTICDRYQINHSDLMRRAISEFVQTHTENPENNGKLMFVWLKRIFVSLGYPPDITTQNTLLTPCRGVFFCLLGKGSEKGVLVIHRVGLILRCIGKWEWNLRIFTGNLIQTPHFLHFLSDFSYENPDRISVSHICCAVVQCGGWVGVLILLVLIHIISFVVSWCERECFLRCAWCDTE